MKAVNQKDLFISVLKEDPCDDLAKERDIQNECSGCPYENDITESSSCFEQRYADLLIHRGAVLPPVDVGQTVWYINGGYYNSARLRATPIVVTEINKKKCGKSVDWAFIANGTRYKFTSIGKAVFLSEQDCLAEIEKRKLKSQE